MTVAERVLTPVSVLWIDSPEVANPGWQALPVAQTLPKTLIAAVAPRNLPATVVLTVMVMKPSQAPDDEVGDEVIEAALARACSGFVGS